MTLTDMGFWGLVWGFFVVVALHFRVKLLEKIWVQSGQGRLHEETFFMSIFTPLVASLNTLQVDVDLPSPLDLTFLTFGEPKKSFPICGNREYTWAVLMTKYTQCLGFFLVATCELSGHI